MKKLALLVVLVLTLLVSSSVFAVENWVPCGGEMNPGQDWMDSCNAVGGKPMCSADSESALSSRCDYTDVQGNPPICTDGTDIFPGYVNISVIDPTITWRTCPEGSHGYNPLQTIATKRLVNILPPVPEELLVALFGPKGDTPYQDVVNVPEGKVLIVRTQANRGPLRFDSEIIKGWTADLNMPLAYAVSKRCFAEAIAEEPMMYRLLPATMQKDNQYWLRCRNLEPIIIGCSDKEIVSPEELEDLRIEEPWKNFIKILSHQGDPWAFKPIFDEDGNIVGPSPKLGFELK